jgi:hypothetical protein
VINNIQCNISNIKLVGQLNPIFNSFHTVHQDLLIFNSFHRYTKTYSEKLWLDAVASLSERYKDNKYVVGHDIRNELRGAHGVEPTW